MVRIDVLPNHSQGGSCLMNRLAHHQGIHKFFTMLGLALYFSKPVMKHLVHIVD
ncbi:IS701 family transposase, partial [Geobacillus stearothermophilus]|nr:IS701 family transposase [Geobacillus stearothermophilus]